MSGQLDERWRKVRQLWEIIDSLRGEPGCPWDKKQTPQSVQTYLLEEAHEAAAAIRADDLNEAAEELGDVLFMVFFLVHLYEEQGSFTLDDAADSIIQKMIRRHPHVFGDVTVNSTREVKENWEKIKAGEAAANGKTKGEIPESLPALVRAYRMISRKVSGSTGKDWDDVRSRTGALTAKAQAIEKNLENGSRLDAETLGDILIELVNIARIQGFRPEDCLHERLKTLSASGEL
jgi:MazG family protein